MEIALLSAVSPRHPGLSHLALLVARFHQDVVGSHIRRHLHLVHSLDQRKRTIQLRTRKAGLRKPTVGKGDLTRPHTWFSLVHAMMAFLKERLSGCSPRLCNSTKRDITLESCPALSTAKGAQAIT